VSGRMLDGLASGVGTSVRRTQSAIEESGQKDLVAYVQDGWRRDWFEVHILTVVSVCSHYSPVRTARHNLPNPARSGGLRMLDFCLHSSGDWALTCCTKMRWRRAL